MLNKEDLDSVNTGCFYRDVIVKPVEKVTFEDKYQQFKDLNKMIIKPAIAELNEKSDLVVTVETIKKGRTVVALHFRFKEDKQIKMTI